jgi:hypothetical protein
VVVKKTRRQGDKKTRKQEIGAPTKVGCADLCYTESVGLRFGTFVPDGLDTVAEVVENVATLDATAGGQEAADDARDVAADVKGLGVVDTDTLFF